MTTLDGVEMMKMPFLRTKFYPVNIDRKIIYNDPKRTERECSVCRPYDMAKDQGVTIGLRGERLNQHLCYQSYQIQPPLRTCY